MLCCLGGEDAKTQAATTTKLERHGGRGGSVKDVGFDLSDKFVPFFAGFAEGFITVTERDVKLVQFVSGVANDFERITGIGGDVEVAF